jgi:N-acyl-D-aspartate/D-glutamate deacylase
MRALVREALDAGAVGFSTSKAPTHVGAAGKPVPSRAAELAEIETLAGALGDAGRGVMQATVGPGLFFDEFAGIARRTGRPVTWTALLSGMLGPGSHRTLLDRSLALIRDGLPIVPQVACRPLNVDFDLAEPFPFESMRVFHPVSAADREGKKRLYRDSEFRRAFKEALAGRRGGPLSSSWDRAWISFHPTDHALEERRVDDVARERGVDPVDLVLDLSLATDLRARFRLAVANYDEAEVAELLVERETVLGLSDAGAHASQLCDACFATHLLGHWVRERETLRLEEAVRMLTSRAAEVLGLADRGLLATGRPADVVVFDPRTVGASKLRRVRDMPGGAERLVADATGIDAVVVNGRPIRRDARDAVDPAGPLPGAVLRSGRAAI